MPASEPSFPARRDAREGVCEPQAYIGSLPSVQRRYHCLGPNRTRSLVRMPSSALLKDRYVTLPKRTFFRCRNRECHPERALAVLPYVKICANRYTLQAKEITMGLAHGFMLISITIVFPFAQRAIFASETQPPFEPTLLIPPKITTSAPMPVSNDSNFALFCNASSTWLAPGFNSDATYSDCVNAVLEILDIASAYQGLHFEFLAAGQTPTRGSFVTRTPLRYTSRE